MFARVVQFMKSEPAGGVTLMAAAALALVVSNTGLRPFYDAWLATPIVVQAGAFEIAKPLVLWVNDGLMAVFFFMVGLEIKREVIKGQLSTFDQAALPLAAAVGGMALPALVFVAFNAGNAATIDGWAIPAATDIAFALGILALLGTRAPLALKVFLLAIAIIDDLGAIVIIALFYTADLSVASLLIGGAGLAVLVAFNRLGVASVAAYVLVGLIVWVGVLKSGVHATLAGVLVALTIPMQARHGGHVHSPLEHLIHGLHPWVAFMILPLFAFANAGVSVATLSLADLASPLPLGIALGLFVGKQIGVLGFTWLAVRSRLCRLPRGVDWAQIYGVACLCGVGFTMSLFIGTLAFDDAALMDGVRLGVLMGSSLSAVVGYLVLRGVAARRAVGATVPA